MNDLKDLLQKFELNYGIDMLLQNFDINDAQSLISDATEILNTMNSEYMDELESLECEYDEDENEE